MEAYMTQISNYLLRQSWQIAILVVVVAVVSWLLRNKSAHIRYLLWLIVLAKCLVPPVTTVPLAILPQESASESASMPPVEEPIITTEIVDMFGPESPPRRLTSAQRPSRPIAEARTIRLTVRQRLGTVWIAGVVVFVLIAMIKALRTELWLKRQRKVLPAGLRDQIENLFSDLNLKTFPNVWLVEAINQPFVWGLLRGGVYLPSDFVNVNSAEQRRGILGHELSHVLRFDAAVNILQLIAQAVFWFHPFVWWANKKIRAEREKCCDEMTIAGLGTEARDYSKAILNVLISEQEQVRSVPSLAVAGQVKNVEERIKTMLRPGKKFYKHPSLVSMTVILLLALLVVPTALVLTAKAQEKTKGELPPAPTAKDKAAATAALFRAIRDTNIERMRLAINQGADLEAKNKDSIWLVDNVQSIGCTPLYVAVGVPEGNNDMIGLLLKAGANPNTRAPNGEIALHEAARGWNIQIVELLVSAGSDVNAADKEGRTPAIIAFELGHYNMFDLMVGRGATVSADLMSAYKGNLSRVQSLIENGKAQERFEQGLTLLHAAAAGGDAKITDLLLTNGLDVRSQTQRGYTALHYAAAGNHREVAELLLAKGADINAEPGELTPLHWAVRERHKDMINWLLVRGANPNADAFGTPLHWAVWWWDVDTTLLLVSHGADIHLYTQSYPFSPLFDSVRGGARDMVEALVTKTGDIKAAQWAPLHAAAASGNRQAIEDLLAKGADVNAKGERGFLALHLAVAFGHKDVAELLIEKGADVNAKTANTLWDESMTVLHGTCLHGQKDVAELLIAKGAEVNAKSKNGYTPLHVAAARGYRDVAELLIAKGADVNAKDNYGRSPSSLAKNRGHVQITELLSKHGAKDETSVMSLYKAVKDRNLELVRMFIIEGDDVNAKDDKGQTPLHYAAKRGHKDVAELLIRNGAVVNGKNTIGHTPLHAAAVSGHKLVVELLIAKGADINATNKLGRTPLHWVARGGRREVAEFLISKGADVDARDKRGKTPISLAKQQGHIEIAELLRKHGAKE